MPLPRLRAARPRMPQSGTLYYSSVFKSKDKAQEFAEYQKANPDDVVPMCMGCHYNAAKEVKDG